MGNKKGKYTGKRKLIGPKLLGELYGVLLMIPAAILLSVLKGSILGRILLSGVLLFFSYFWKKDNPVLSKVILIITACMPWFTVLGIPHRQLLLAEMVLMYVSIGALLYFNIKYHCSSWQVLSVAAFFMLSMMNAFGRYTYAVDGTDMQGWPVYLACAIAVAVTFAVLAINGIIYLKDDRASESIALCLVAAIMGFILPWVTVNNLNYMLDKSEPTVYEMVINEKDISKSRRRTDYYLILNHNGEELKMEISYEKLDTYNVGDTLPVMQYDGAFDKPYFIIE